MLSCISSVNIRIQNVDLIVQTELPAVRALLVLMLTLSVIRQFVWSQVRMPNPRCSLHCSHRMSYFG
jgi:hypothetical protein